MAVTSGRVVRAPRGTELHCANWQIEAPFRMIQNNLNPEVAELPEELIIYGGRGKAARNWPAFDLILESLRRLRPDETLLVQSGKPVGVFRTHELAPRVIIANSNLVPKWATWDHFNELEKRGLIMYGQMTAGSWIYIGTQGIIQGTYETFAEAGRQHFGGDYTGKWALTAGLGGMGGAQPLAITMNGASALVVEVDPARAKRRLEMGFVDELTDSLDEALEKIRLWTETGEARSIGLIANAADVFPTLAERDINPDIVTDQTSAHDELNGYVPNGMSLKEALALRENNPEEYRRRALKAIAEHCAAMAEFRRRGIPVFDYGNNIRGQAVRGGLSEEEAFSFPGFVPAYIRPMFCTGTGPFRWVALSGDPEDILRTDRAIMELFPEKKSLIRWLELAEQKVPFQGLPARICWLGYGERHIAGLRFNEMVAKGELRAPVVIGRDHLDGGSVASPYRETEGMKDGSDAIADWPLLNFALNTASGATWVSFHHGGGVGMGLSLHAGLVVCADGTDLSARRLELCLTNDPGTGVMRHADAGYEEALRCAKERGLNLPGIQSPIGE